MIAQAIFDGALGGGERGRICRRLRRSLLKFSDPIVSWRVNGRTLRLPLSHELPFYRREFPTYSANLGRLTACLRAAHGRVTLIDIGANIGDSVILAGLVDGDACLLIEGDSRYFRLLRENTAGLKGAHCVAAMLSDREEKATGKLVAIGGTGKVVGTDPGQETVQFVTLDSVIARHPQFQDAQLLKVDVDGYDFRVLRGGAAWISAKRPILFFEHDPALLAGAGEVAEAVWRWLGQMGYDSVMLYDNFGFWVGTFPLEGVEALDHLNRYARQRPGAYYDVAAFASSQMELMRGFMVAERQFYGLDARPS
jgi:FkbM family methyltransferase